jgi:small GTP-binding protein
MRKKHLRVVFVGPAGVGKTSLVRVISGQRLNIDTDSSVGVCALTLTTNDGIPVEVWDTAGQERYAPMMDLYTRDADIVVAAHDHLNDVNHRQMKNILERLDALSNTKHTQTFAMWQTKRDLRASANPRIISPFVVYQSVYVSALEDPEEVRELFNDLICLHQQRCNASTKTTIDAETISLTNSINCDENVFMRHRLRCGYC